jgi:hypothetical protein
MDIPKNSHPNWMKVITEQISPNFNCLATKMLVGRLRLRYKRDPTPDNSQDCVAELCNYFNKHQSIPKILNDLNAIFN